MAGKIYFVGEDRAHGRELWQYAVGMPQASTDPLPGAEIWLGSNSSLPRELSAMGDDLFWRAYDDQGAQRWYHLGPTGQAEGSGFVLSQGFDAGQSDDAQRNLGVRAGDYFWGAVADIGFDSLTGWDTNGTRVAAVPLQGTGRHALADTLDAPAYAATVSALNFLTGQISDRQQVLVVLKDPVTGDWTTVSATSGGAADNRIDAIVGGPAVTDPAGSGDKVKTIYFAGRFDGAEGLFQVQLRHAQGTSEWVASAPLRLDDLINGGAPLAPTELLVTGPGVAGLGLPHLFFFGQNAAGQGRIFQLANDPFTLGSAVLWSSADLNGSSLQGQQLMATDAGVVFSAASATPGGSVVGRYSPGGLLQPFVLNVDATLNSPVEQLVADGHGRYAFVESDGFIQSLWLNDAAGLRVVRVSASPMTQLQLTDAHLVWSGVNGTGTGMTLFDHDIASDTTREVTSPSDNDGPGLDGLPSYNSGRWAPTAVPGALVFPAIVNAAGDMHLQVVEGGTANDLGLARPGPGDALGASWVGSVEGVGTGHGGVARFTPGAGIDWLAGGPTDPGSFGFDVAVLGNQVLFGQTSPQHTLLAYDASTDSTRAIAFNQDLGAAERVGNEIIFAARDLQAGGNWRINSWNGQAITPLASLPANPGFDADRTNPLAGWRGEQDFVGDAQHVFFVATHAALGQELHVVDRSSGSLTVVDLIPGASGGAGGLAYAGGRAYWLGMQDPQMPHLWSTSNGSDWQRVTGDGLKDLSGLSVPVAVGDQVFFVGQTETHAALFQVASDGVSAVQVFGFEPNVSYYPMIESLVAIDGDLYFVRPEGVFSQVWRYTPGAPGVPGSAVPLTSLPAWTLATGHIAKGGDGQIYFSADDEAGEELWMVDAAAPGGARRVADLNPGRQGDGYEPSALTPLPDPTEGTSSADVVVFTPPLPEVHLTASLVRQTEGTGPGQTMLLVFGERVGDLSGTTVISVDLSGIDYIDPLTGEHAQAADGDDVLGGVLPLTGEVTLTPGLSGFTVGIGLNRDALSEGTEAILMRLTSVTGGVFSLFGDRQAVALIVDDDATPPQAHPDSLRTPIGQWVELPSSGLLANDEPSAALLDIVGFVDTHGTPDPADDSVVSRITTNAGNEVELVLHASPGLDDGSRQSVLLTPTAVPSGSAGGLDRFSYVVRDASGRESRAEAAWDITNVPPVARPDTVFAVSRPGAPGPVVPITALLANDNDADGGAVHLASWQATSGTGGTLAPWRDAAGVLQGLVYTPGTTSVAQETFSYAIHDGDGSHPTLHGTANSTFTVSVAPTVAFAPATDHFDEGSPGAARSIAVAVSRSGNLSLASDVQYVVEPGAGIQRIDAADLVGGLAGGTLHFEPGQAQALLTLPITADADVEPDESFTVRLVGGSNVDLRDDIPGVTRWDAIITNDDMAPNVPPVALPDTYALTEDQGLSVPAEDGVLFNDHDPDGTVGLTARLTQAPQHGRLDLRSDGAFDYMPFGDYNGSDSFTYVARDGRGGETAATVSLQVGAVNDAPTFARGGVGVFATSGLLDTYSYEITAQPDGKVLLGGYVPVGGTKVFTIVRLNLDGSLDTSFGSAGSLTTSSASIELKPRSVTLQPDGKLVVAGFALNINTPDFSTVRYNADGSLDTSFGIGGQVTTPTLGYEWMATVIVQPDGRLVVSGSNPAVFADSSDFITTRYNADGSRDLTFGVQGTAITAYDGGYAVAGGVALQPDGRLLVAGYVIGDATPADFAVMRYNIDGTLDSTFGTGGKLLTEVGWSRDFGASVAVQPDGKVVVAGSVETGSDFDFAIVRYNADGSLDTSFGDGGKVVTSVISAGDLAYSVAVQPDGRLLVAGQGVERGAVFLGLVRYNADGSLDQRFHAANTLGGTVAFTEGSGAGVLGSPVVLDADVGVFDVELAASGSYAGARLVLARHGGANADDRFSAKPGGTLGALIEGQPLTVGGTAIGTVTMHAGGSLVLDFNLQATEALVNRSLQQIAYANASDTPPADVVIGWTFSDGNAGNAQGEGSNPGLATGSVTVQITAVNDAPIPVADHLQTRAGQALSVPVAELFRNDRDPEGDSILLAGVSPPAQGVVTLADVGGVTQLIYTPAPGFTGTDTFSYFVTDGVSTGGSATVTVDVAAVPNVPPQALADSYTLPEDSLLTRSAVQGLLANDSDADAGAVLQARLVSAPAHGTLTLRPDGSFDYRPHADFNGSDAFTYVAVDEFGAESAVAQVALTITAVNDAPRMAGPDAMSDGAPPLAGERGTDALLLPDGRIVLVGSGSVNAAGSLPVQRLLADGRPDGGFGLQQQGWAEFSGSNQHELGEAVLRLPDGKLLVVGQSVPAHPASTALLLARYAADGRLDTSFGQGGQVRHDLVPGTDWATDVVLTGSGHLVVAVQTRLGNQESALLRLNLDGSIDTSFGIAGLARPPAVPEALSPRAVVEQGDGRLLLLDMGTGPQGDIDFRISRFNIDGSLDTTYGQGGVALIGVAGHNDYGRSLLLQADGKLLVVGQVAGTQGPLDVAVTVARLNADGTPDASFGVDGVVLVPMHSEQIGGHISIAVQADGKLLVSGNVAQAATGIDVAVARLLPDGTLDSSFGVNGIAVDAIPGSQIAHTVLLQPDGRIVVAADDDSPVQHLGAVRFEPDGGIDRTFGAADPMAGSIAYTEGTGYQAQGTPVRLNPQWQVLDVELAARGDYSAGGLRVERSGGSSEDDHFVAIGAVMSQVASSGVSVGGVVIGHVVNNDQGRLHLRFNGDATQARVDQLLQSLAYTSTSDNPPAHIDLAWSLYDGNNGAQGEPAQLGILEGQIRVLFSATMDNPIGQDDFAQGPAGQVLHGLSVLANDRDPDGDPLSAILEAAPAHGSVVLRTDGTFDYTPNPGFSGSDSFRYLAADRFGLTQGPNGNTVHLTIAPDLTLRAPTLDVDTPALLEGDVQTLTITPAAFGGDAATLLYRIDWGDGSPVQTVSGAQLAAVQGVFTHAYADDPDGPVNQAALTLTVTVSDPASGQSAQATQALTIEDLLPSVGVSFDHSVIEHDTPYTLAVNLYRDVAGDPLQQLRVQWDGDPASAQAVTVGGSAARSFGGLQPHQVQLDVINDDGTFTAFAASFSTAATVGQAAPNGTPAQWLAAWTDSLLSVSHKADMGNPLEGWSPASLSAVNSGVLAGGDLYGGLLGVSGRSANTSTVRQEIDGTEALRIELSAGTRADTLILDLARLFTNDAPGLNEAATVLLYDGSSLVGSSTLRAANANGKLHVELLHQPEFTSVVLRAGLVDAGGAFQPGGLVDAQGGFVPATATTGSDFLVEALQFLNLPDVLLTGQPADAGG